MNVETKFFLLNIKEGTRGTVQGKVFSSFYYNQYMYIHIAYFWRLLKGRISLTTTGQQVLNHCCEPMRGCAVNWKLPL